MSDQIPDRLPAKPAYLEKWHEAYLEEKTEDYNELVKEFKSTDEEEFLNLDPKSKTRLRAQRDNQYKEIKKLYDEIKNFCIEHSYDFSLELPKLFKYTHPRCKPRTVALVGLGITGLFVLARFLKLLQPLELGFYDHLIRFRLDSKPSDKVLVIEITDQDIRDQQAKGQTVIGSLSNETLEKVLEKVDQLKPIAVGLDIYRDNVSLNSPQDQALKKRFSSEHSSLFTVCKSPFTNDEVSPPPDAHPNRVTFSDNVTDSDGVIRRYTLAYSASRNAQATSQSDCNTNLSLGLLLASQYLKIQHGVELENLSAHQNEFSSDNAYCLKFTDSQNLDVIFPNFQRYWGGYQNVQHYTKCQILINYQRRTLVKYSPENRTNAEKITLKEFLSDPEFPREKYQNRVVLIGSVSYNTVKDYWNTPYTSISDGDGTSGEGMPGVEIQAQIVNQIINTVLPNSGGRPMIWVLPQWRGIQWGEFFWIWAWSLAGGFLVWWWRFPKSAVIAIAGACISGYIVCFLIFQLNGGWFPFIPAVGALMSTGAIVYWLTWRSAPRERVETVTA